MTEPDETPIQLREVSWRDKGLIYNSWLKSYHKSEYARAIPAPVYFKEHHRLVTQILDRAQVHCIVSEEDDNQVFGWVCFESEEPLPIVHYLYVKHTYRGLGFAKLLFRPFDGRVFLFTHETEAVKHWRHQGVYSPYRAFWGKG